MWIKFNGATRSLTFTVTEGEDKERRIEITADEHGRARVAREEADLLDRQYPGAATRHQKKPKAKGEDSSSDEDTEASENEPEGKEE